MREKIEKILAQVLMKHHDDISKQDDDAIAEAADAVLEIIREELLKKEIMVELQRGGDMEYSIKIIYPDGNFLQSVFMDITQLVNYIYNQAYAEIEAKLRGK